MRGLFLCLTVGWSITLSLCWPDSPTAQESVISPLPEHPAPAFRQASVSPETGPPELRLRQIETVYLGPANRADPFGIALEGPLQNSAKSKLEITPPFTLKDAVDFLDIQAIFPRDRDCFINGVLFAAGNSFLLVNGANRYQLRLDQVGGRGITFSWDQDRNTSLFTFVPPPAFDPFLETQRPLDPLEPTLPVFDITPLHAP